MRRTLVCTSGVSRDLPGAVEFIGQVGQQIGRRHLRKDQMHERRALRGQHAAEHGRQQGFARARRAGQQRRAAAVLDGVSQLQQRRLVRFGRIVEARIGGVLERFLRQIANRIRTWFNGPR